MRSKSVPYVISGVRGQGINYANLIGMNSVNPLPSSILRTHNVFKANI